MNEMTTESEDFASFDLDSKAEDSFTRQMVGILLLLLTLTFLAIAPALVIFVWRWAL